MTPTPGAPGRDEYIEQLERQVDEAFARSDAMYKTATTGTEESAAEAAEEKAAQLLDRFNAEVARDMELVEQRRRENLARYAASRGR